MNPVGWGCHALITLLVLIILPTNIFTVLCNPARSLAQDSIQWNLSSNCKRAREREAESVYDVNSGF